MMYVLALLMLMLSFMQNKPSFNANMLSVNTVKYYYAYYFSDHKKAFAYLEEQYKVDIIYNIDDDFLNEDIFNVSLNNSAQQMSDFQLARYSVLLLEFFSKYPKSIIHDELKMIKLSGALILYGIRYGGTSVGSSVYLTGMDYHTDVFAEEIFHHEFSSILMRNHKFPQDAWQASNLTEFKYALRRAIVEDTDRVGNDLVYSKGFLTKYAMSNLENDFNVMAEQVFTNPKRLKILIQQYPIIKKKYILLREFYLGIDPKFINVFDKLN